MVDDPSSVSERIAEVRASHPMVGHLRLALGPCVVEVAANRAAVLSELGDYFAEFRAADGARPQIRISVIDAPPTDLGLAYTIKQPDPGKNKIKEEYAELPGGRAVRKRLTDMLFLFGRDEHLAYGPCAANLNQVVNFVNNRFIQWCLDRGHLLGHAAGVTLSGRGLALAGFSGMGKSTLALALMSLGATFVSNDRLMIRRATSGLEMTGVAKLPRVNPGTLLNNAALADVMPRDARRRAERLPNDELWTLEQKYDVPIDSCFGAGRFVLRAPLHGLAILNWQRGCAPLLIRQVSLAERPDLLGAFTKAPGLFYLPRAGASPSQHAEEAYLTALNGCPVYELTGGVDFPVAARELPRVLSAASRGSACGGAL